MFGSRFSFLKQDFLFFFKIHDFVLTKDVFEEASELIFGRNKFEIVNKMRSKEFCNITKSRSNRTFENVTFVNYFLLIIHKLNEWN